MPDDKLIEAASRNRTDAASRELWAEIDARSRKIDRGLRVGETLVAILAVLLAAAVAYSAWCVF